METVTGSEQFDDPAQARLLRALFDQVPALVAFWDAEARNVIANAAYIEWLGLTPQQIRGMHISDVLGPEVYAVNERFVEAALAGHEQLFDRTMVDRTGRTRHTQGSYVPQIVDGEVRGFFALITDVTPRVEAQRAAEQAQSLAHLGSWDYQPALRLATWSREMFNIVGADYIDGPVDIDALTDYIHPADRDRVIGNIREAISTGAKYTIEYRIVRRDGAVREVVSNGRPVTDTEGAVVRVTGTLQDVTEANSTARALAATNADMRRANELNADVIAMLGHDIRNPLTAVRGYLELVNGDWPHLTDAKKQNLTREAQSATERLTRMIDRILSLAAVDSGTIEPRLEPIELADAVRATAQTWSLPGIPEVVQWSTTALVGLFDRVHLEQVIGNLLVNAFRYGAEPVRVVIDAADDSVSVSIVDAGAGVPSDAQESLFTRFAHTGSRQAAAGGTGFGLYMASRLAAANRGTLTYRPGGPGQPHAFVLRMPSASSLTAAVPDPATS